MLYKFPIIIIITTTTTTTTTTTITVTNYCVKQNPTAGKDLIFFFF